MPTTTISPHILRERERERDAFMCCDEESEQLREQEVKRRELVIEKQEKKQRLGERERERVEK